MTKGAKQLEVMIRIEIGHSYFEAIPSFLLLTESKSKSPQIFRFQTGMVLSSHELELMARFFTSMKSEKRRFHLSKHSYKQRARDHYWHVWSGGGVYTVCTFTLKGLVYC